MVKSMNIGRSREVRTQFAKGRRLEVEIEAKPGVLL